MALPLSRLLEAIAEHGSVERAAEVFGVDVSAVRDGLREAARRLEPKASSARQTSLFDAPATKRPTVPAKASAPVDELHPSGSAFTHLVVHTDGAARGNPGPAGAGAVISRPDGEILTRLGRYLGVQTNNVAEYEGVILGLNRALELGGREVDLRADSLLVINQLKGEWKVKHEGLKPYYERARTLMRRFERVSLGHVRREFNKDADEMSNRAIDEKM